MLVELCQRFATTCYDKLQYLFCENVVVRIYENLAIQILACFCVSGHIVITRNNLHCQKIANAAITVFTVKRDLEAQPLTTGIMY